MMMMSGDLESCCVVRVYSGRRLLLDGLLEAVQKLLLELHDLLNVAEQPLDVLDRQERLLLQRLQVPLDQTVYVLPINADISCYISGSERPHRQVLPQ